MKLRAASLLFSVWTVNLYLARMCRSVDTKILGFCIAQNSCENCLEANLACAWCSDWTYSNSTHGKPRCNVPERLHAFGCPAAEIRTAPPGSLELLENEDFQDVSNDRAPVQLRPQRLRLRIRPRASQELRLQYRPAK